MQMQGWFLMLLVLAGAWLLFGQYAAGDNHACRLRGQRYVGDGDADPSRYEQRAGADQSIAIAS
jgi:hypothetical protein